MFWERFVDSMHLFNFKTIALLYWKSRFTVLSFAWLVPASKANQQIESNAEQFMQNVENLADPKHDWTIALSRPLLF